MPAVKLINHEPRTQGPQYLLMISNRTSTLNRDNVPSAADASARRRNAKLWTFRKQSMPFQRNCLTTNYYNLKSQHFSLPIRELACYKHHSGLSNRQPASWTDNNSVLQPLLSSVRKQITVIEIYDRDYTTEEPRLAFNQKSISVFHLFFCQ